LRRNIITAPPKLYLRFAKFDGHFRFIQALQIAVVTLVQLPGPDHRDPFQAHFFHDDPQGFDGPLEDRGIGQVEGVSFGLEQLAGIVGLFQPQFGQADIRPPCEPVFQVPGALSVADQDDFISSSHSVSLSHPKIIYHISPGRGRCPNVD